MKEKNSEGAFQKSVLVTDDNESITEMLKNVLESRYQVTTVNDSLKALELILATNYDLIISDIVMPHMNGIELHQEVRRKRPGIERRMLFISGALDGWFRDILEATGNLFLSKPFSLWDLLAVVNYFFTVYQVDECHSTRSQKLDEVPLSISFKRFT